MSITDSKLYAPLFDDMSDYWKNQPRVPKGRPNGGQFASIKHRFDSTEDVDINFVARRLREK